MSIYIGTTEITQRGSGLPNTYQEVEYIQSSGTQYINTGHKPTIYDSVEIKFQTEASTSDTNLYGSRHRNTATPAAQDFSIWINTSSGKGIAVHYPFDNSELGYTDTSWFYTSDIINTPVTLKVTPQHCYVNGSIKYTFNVTRTNYTPDYNAFLFAKNETGATSDYKIGKFKIYSAKIWNNGTLVRDFVPCYRKSDSVIGLYDLVNSVFYTNSGTGTFTKGSDISTKGIYVGTTPVKSVYVGTTKVRPTTYEYSYDFRNKTESQIYNDGWSKFRGRVQINSNGITSTNNTDFVLTHPANLSSANKIIVQASIVFNRGDTGYATIYGLSSTSTPQQNNAVFYIASSSNYGGIRTKIVANGTASEGTNVGGIGTSSYTPNLIIDLANKTMNGIVDGKTSTYTLTDTQVFNIRNLNGIYLYCTQANFYIGDVKLTVE